MLCSPKSPLQAKEDVAHAELITCVSNASETPNKVLDWKYDAGWDLANVAFRIRGTFELVPPDAKLAEFSDRMLIFWPTEQQVRIELPDSGAVKVRSAH
jgi:hypothetical protein